MYTDALWVLFDNPRNTCHFLLYTLIEKLLKTFTILFAMSSENTMTTSEKDSAQLASHMKESEKDGQ
jgi:hypothetical protein